MSAGESTLGVAVVAAGARGRAHAKAWHALPDTTVRVVADTDEDRARQLADELGAEWSGTPREVVVREDVDIVSVCTPAAFHAEYVCLAAEHGKHVLCEKPIALTLEDADRMISATRENNVVLSFSFQTRFSEATDRIRDLIQSGEVGRPIMVRMVSGAEIRPKIAMHDKLHGNNGPIVDVLCHSVNNWRYWFDSEPVRVRASGMILAKDAEELKSIEALAIDTGTVIVDFASGDVGSFSVSWGLPKGVKTGGMNDMLGPKGVIIPGHNQVKVIKRGGEETVIDGLARNMDLEQARYFVACVRGEKQPINTGEDAKITLRVSLAALESIETGKAVVL